MVQDDRIFLQPGDSHPHKPNWKVEQIHHSPDHMALKKFQWVRRDGVRATLMGWLPQLFAEREPFWRPQGGNIGCEFDINIADKHKPLGDDDLSLMTVRWHSWDAAAAWEHPEGATPMVFGERA